MNGAIAAEDQRRVGLVGGIEFVADKQVDARHLESPDVVLSGDRSKQGNSAHRATFAHASANAKRERTLLPPSLSSQWYNLAEFCPLFGLILRLVRSCFRTARI